MFLQFHRAVEYLDVWSASSADISFVRQVIAQSPSPKHDSGTNHYKFSKSPI
jgi:hypothetical protein